MAIGRPGQLDEEDLHYVRSQFAQLAFDPGHGPLAAGTDGRIGGGVRIDGGDGFCKGGADEQCLAGVECDAFAGGPGAGWQ
jgi:hypothetical protein